MANQLAEKGCGCEIVSYDCYRNESSERSANMKSSNQGYVASRFVNDTTVKHAQVVLLAAAEPALCYPCVLDHQQIQWNQLSKHILGDGQTLNLKRSEGMRLPRINSRRVWLGRMQRYRLRCVFTYSPNTRPVRIAWLGFEVDYKVSRFK